MFGQSGKAFPQFFFLGSHSDRAVIGVANPGHNAAFRNHGNRAKAKFFRPHERAHHHIPTGLEAAIHSENHPISQLVFHQHPMHFRKTQFPRTPGVFDRTQGRCSGATVMARNLDNIGIGFSDPSSNCANSDFGHQFDRYLGLGIDLMQVKN